MKRIRTIIIYMVIFLIGLSMISACGKKVNSYYINDNGDLIAVYKNNKEKNLGSWGDELILSLKQVSVDNNGYYIINGVKTSITTKVPKEYSVNSNGHLIVKYKDNTTDDLGDLSKSLASGVFSIEISDDCFYIINGVKTSISTKVPKEYSINNNGHLIVKYKDNTTDNLGDFSESLVNGVLSVEISDDGYYIINGIKTNIIAFDVYNVSFNSGFSQTISSQKIKDGYKVERPAIERKGYTLSKWICNGEEWQFNSDVVKNDMTLDAIWTANEYTVSFENEKGDNPIDIVITYDSEIVLPTVDNVDGYTFRGWYNGSTRITDGIWNIDNNITLTAKWTANKYNITLNPNGGSVSQTTIQVTYGEKYTLPVPTNDYGVFTGWLYDGNPITDSLGKSIQKYEFTNNITANVDWTIEIYTVEDLLKLNDYLNGEFILMDDIDLDGVNWVPVGSANNPFFGKLDGNNHCISNLSFDTSNYSNISSFGLFGYVSNAKIKNLRIENISFVSENLSRSYSVGAISGVSNNAVNSDDFSLDNISTSGIFNIAKQSTSYPVYAGGLIGHSTNDWIEKCTNGIQISNATYAGGLIGLSDNYLYLISCGNNSKIESSLYAGGLVAKCDNVFGAEKCFNKGRINSVQAAGGLAGSVNYYSLVSYSYNTGNVISVTDNNFVGAGGLIGCCYFTEGTHLPEISINDCYNRGTINAPYAGGLCGPTYKIEITNSYNSGYITGKQVGALFSLSSTGSVKQSLGAGNIHGSVITATHGISLVNVEFIDCYHNYSSTNGFGKINGTYSENVYGSSLYVNDMFWQQYNVNTGRGVWNFDENDFPVLAWEALYN